MTRVASRTFCCCIPVRAGVVFLSILGLLGGGTVAAAGIINVKYAEGSKVAAIVQIVVYILLTIVSLFGLIGAITKRLGFIRTYMSMLIVHLLFSMAWGIFAIYRNFKDAPKYYADCVSNPDGTPSSDPTVVGTCKSGATLLKSLMISFFIIGWLLEIWACFIVGNYSKQLVEEERANMVKDAESW